MYNHHHHHHPNSETSRMAVADILSTMSAVNGHDQPITPSTYAALEGFSTGVLTQTTPTLTPTTLRSIEQTFIELQAVPPPHSLTRHHNEAGFVPPVVNVVPIAAAACTGGQPPTTNCSSSASSTTTASSSSTTTTTTTTTTTISSSTSASSISSTSTAFLGAHNGSTVITYQTLTAKSVASVGGGDGSGAGCKNDVNGMSSSASSSGSSTTSASDVINDNGGWSGHVNHRSGGRTSSGGGDQPSSKGGNAKGRNMGGRRPAKYEKLTPEEEERRRVRRERNKLAAARCRKRRMDHTNSLIYETEGLEDQRSSLQSEIQDLQSQKDELEFILEAHKVVCKLQRQALQHCHREHRENRHDYGRAVDDEQPQQIQQQHDDSVDIKPDVSQLNVAIQQQIQGVSGGGNAGKRSRPNSLALSSTFAVPHVLPQQQQHQHQQHQQHQQQHDSHPLVTTSSSSNRLSLTEATGIAISTPSNGMFNFEALMEGGTGLTPVSCSGGLTPIAVPTCSTQQRSSGSDCLSSPEGSLNGPPKLVSL